MKDKQEMLELLIKIYKHEIMHGETLGCLLNETVHLIERVTKKPIEDVFKNE